MSEDGKRIVGIGPDVLSVHMLRPYQQRAAGGQVGWEEFRGRIDDALDAYWPLSKPKGVRRIGVRYINKIDIPKEAAKLDEYFRCALPEVPSLPKNVTGFVGRIEYQYVDGVRLVLSQGTSSTTPDRKAFLLDIDVIWETEAPLSRDETLEKAEDLRNRERQAFEALITDKARELFDES